MKEVIKMDFPQIKKMCDLRIGDVFVRGIFTYVAIDSPHDNTIWVTVPELVNEEDIYGYTSAILLKYKPNDKVKVISKDERPLKLLR